MALDLRIPMGLMFTLVGIILVAFGLATNGNTDLYARCLGINANLWWGLVLLVFGQTMFQLGRRSQKRMAKLPPPPPGEMHGISRGHRGGDEGTRDRGNKGVTSFQLSAFCLQRVVVGGSIG